MTNFVDATFYAQVEGRLPWKGAQEITSASVVAITQAKPTRPRSGTVTVKLTLRLPKSVFLPLQPEAIVLIPESLINQNVEVEAVNPE